MTMKITRLETIWLDEQPNTTWVRIFTDDGLVGLGETFYVPRAISAMVHDVFANLLLGRSAFDIESHWQNMFYTVNFFGYGGSETRAISAVDVALWDLLGQYTGQPIYNLLGGPLPRPHLDLQHLCRPRQAPGLPALVYRARRRTGRRAAGAGRQGDEDLAV